METGIFENRNMTLYVLLLRCGGSYYGIANCNADAPSGVYEAKEESGPFCKMKVTEPACELNEEKLRTKIHFMQYFFLTYSCWL